MVAKITRDAVESHLACRYESHLKLTARQGHKSDYERWLVESRTREKHDAMINLVAHCKESEIVERNGYAVGRGGFA